ncbi:MAG: hypothetical protein DMF79_18875, partial [Acidobacteria bacterium]
MGDPVVLADEGVEKGLPRTGIAHGGGEGGEQGAVRRVVRLHQGLVGPEAHRRGDVVVLGLAHQGVDDEAVRELEGELGQVLVGAVDRVPGLEARHPLPPPLRDPGAQGSGSQAMRGEGQVLGKGKDGDRTRHQPPRPRQQVGHSGVRGVLGPVDLARLETRVALEDLAHVDHPPETAVPVAQGGRLARLEGCTHRLLHGQGEGQRPDRAVGQPQVQEHARVIGRAQEAGEGARGPGGDELQVGQLAGVQGERGQARGPA